DILDAQHADPARHDLHQARLHGRRRRRECRAAHRFVASGRRPERLRARGQRWLGGRARRGRRDQGPIRGRAMKRWRWLFWSALMSLVGVSWLAKDYGISLWGWMNVQLVGMIGASGFAFFALATRARVKWPAAAALVCAAPMTIEMVRAVKDLGHVIE